MINRKVSLVISGGTKEGGYREIYSATLKQIFLPFEITFKYMKADYLGHFALSGIEHTPSPEIIEQSVEQYMDFLQLN